MDSFAATPTTDLLEDIIESLLTAIEARDAELRRHSERVARYACEVATAMGMDAAALNQLRLGSLLHDIGNIGIPDSILLKPSGLSGWEFDEMKLHCIIGESICRPIGMLAPALPLIRSHHEKLDGSGYPDALWGNNIPLPVRVLSVTDVYDTLRSERAYRDAFTHEKAIEILRDEAKRGWWDDQIVSRLADLTAPSSDFIPV
jgi:HD-GYP domain-containing protein (c-di-GMP phosphodiesterase class II)